MGLTDLSSDLHKFLIRYDLSFASMLSNNMELSIYSPNLLVGILKSFLFC